MINIVCRQSHYKTFQDYIDSIVAINKMGVILYDKTTDISIDDDSYYIFCQEIPSNILKNKDNHRRFCLFNTEQLTVGKNKFLAHNTTTYVRNILDLGIYVIDYDRYQSRMLNNSKQMYLPYQCYDKENLHLSEMVKTYPKEYDVVICAMGASERRKYVFNELKSSGINIVEVSGWKDDRDKVIARSKILLNIHYDKDYQIFEHIRCDRWLFAGQIVVSETSVSDELLDNNLLFIENYDDIVGKVTELIDNYDIIYKKHRNRVNESLNRIKINGKKECEMFLKKFTSNGPVKKQTKSRSKTKSKESPRKTKSKETPSRPNEIKIINSSLSHVNGIYRRLTSSNLKIDRGTDIYEKDAYHHIYRYKGSWRIAQHGVQLYFELDVKNKGNLYLESNVIDLSGCANHCEDMPNPNIISIVNSPLAHVNGRYHRITSRKFKVDRGTDVYEKDEYHHIYRYKGEWRIANYGKELYCALSVSNPHKNFIESNTIDLSSNKKGIAQSQVSKPRVIKKSYNYNNSRDKLIIMSHGMGGGLSQYIINLVDAQIANDKMGTFDILINEETNIKKSNVINLTNDEIINALKRIERKPNQKIILHMNILPLLNIRIKSPDKYITFVSDFVDILCKKDIKIMITIHDFFWLFPLSPTLLADTFKTKEPQTRDICQKLFNRADLIIFPSHRINELYREKSIVFDNVNYVVQPHPDIIHDSIEPYYPIIKNKELRIIYVGVKSKHKGIDLWTKMVDELMRYQKVLGYNITFYLIGSGDSRIKIPKSNSIRMVKVGRYTNDNILKLINRVKPNIALLMSICEETYSYVLSICLKLGIPLFYNDMGAYKERIEATGRENVKSFNSLTHSAPSIARNLFQFTRDVNKNSNKDYIPVSESYDVVPNDFYKSMYSDEFFDRYLGSKN
jgi:hypothetical protein